MSGLFLVRPLQPGAGPSLIVRAAGLECARRVAVEQAGAEGTIYWRDPAQTEVRAIQVGGAFGVILRAEG